MMSVNRFFLALAMLLAVLLPAALRAQSQTTAQASGTVLDPDGKAVVNAVVMIRNESTSADLHNATTGGSGRFSVSGLLPGTYTIEVAVPGFDLVRRSGVS